MTKSNESVQSKSRGQKLPQLNFEKGFKAAFLKIHFAELSQGVITRAELGKVDRGDWYFGAQSNPRNL